MKIPRFAPDKDTGKKKEAYYVHIPAIRDSNGQMKPERARPARAFVNEYYYPRETINEYIYALSNNKKYNESDLYFTKEECEAACEKINEELAQAQAAKIKPINKKSESIA